MRSRAGGCEKPVRQPPAGGVQDPGHLVGDQRPEAVTEEGERPIEGDLRHDGIDQRPQPGEGGLVQPGASAGQLDTEHLHLWQLVRPDDELACRTSTVREAVQPVPRLRTPLPAGEPPAGDASTLMVLSHPAYLLEPTGAPGLDERGEVGDGWSLVDGPGRSLDVVDAPVARAVRFWQRSHLNPGVSAYIASHRHGLVYAVQRLDQAPMA